MTPIRKHNGQIKQIIIGKDITYIAAITNPDGYRMAEFTGGPESGWMGTLE